jgi:anaphase-promoting complex subunit 2
MKLCYKSIKDKVLSTISSNYEECYLEDILNWLNSNIYNFILFIFTKNELSNIKNSIEFYFYEVFTKIRINELFGIIVDFPESMNAIKELKECLIKTRLYDELVLSLEISFSKRLLIAGANTGDILSQYINTIKTLNILDPTGVSLMKIEKKIKNYLNERGDTVKCIINGLIGEGDVLTELNEELMNTDTIESDISDSDEEFNPLPIYPDPFGNSKKYNIIKKLIEVYGNKDIFINEYLLKLSVMLLSNFDFEIENVVKIHELLKLRFGEKNLQSSEVMVKDIFDSKRIFESIKNNQKTSKFNYNSLTKSENIKLDDNFMFKPVISSRIFWPVEVYNEENDEKSIELHPLIKSFCEEYSNRYQTLKSPRYLIWLKNAGYIEYELEFPSKTLTFSTTPLLSTIIFLFAEKSTWELYELSKKINMEENILKKKIEFWENKKIITREENGDEVIYTIIEDFVQESIIEDDNMEEEEEEEEIEIESFEPLITHMLTNFDSMSAPKIHNSLKMFAIDPFPPYEKTLNELNIYLNQLTSNGVLFIENGEFKLKK